MDAVEKALRFHEHYAHTGQLGELKVAMTMEEAEEAKKRFVATCPAMQAFFKMLKEELNGPQR